MLIEITDEKSEEIFNDILFDFTFAKTTQTKPLGIILGGQPGAGKSYLVKEVEDEFQNDFIFISTDDLRLYHPVLYCPPAKPRNTSKCCQSRKSVCFGLDRTLNKALYRK